MGFEYDSSLAINIARNIALAGGSVPGNELAGRKSAVYHRDPVPVSSGQFQSRNTKGSCLPGKRGEGISLGSWASTSVCDGRGTRDAISILTIEFPGYVVSSSGPTENQSDLVAYSSALTRFFLSTEQEIVQRKAESAGVSRSPKG